MPVKKTTKTENSESRQRGLRVLKDHDDHLQAKAEANPDNRYNQFASEVNDLIDADFKYTQRTGKFRFAKKRA